MTDLTDAQAADKWHWLRPEVQAYARRMEMMLRAHDEDRGRAGWKNDEAFDLFNHLLEEVNELQDTLWDWRDGAETQNRALRARIGNEAADIGNMAMMVADIYGTWDDDPPAH